MTPRDGDVTDPQRPGRTTLRTPAPGPDRRSRRSILWAATILLLPTAVASCTPERVPSEESSQGAGTGTATIDGPILTGLFDALQAGEGSLPPEIELLLAGERVVAQDDPSWPTVTYLLGEVQRHRGRNVEARDAFRRLASWAVSDHPDGPYGDGWAGSGLAVLGLWRWLQILDDEGPEGPEEVGRALEVASALQETRFYSGMVSGGLLPALPLVEEEIAERLAHIAWANEREEAPALFLDFLSIDSRGEIDSTDDEILQHILSQGLATPERLELFRARRLLSLVKTDEWKERAAESLEGLWENPAAPADVRAEAAYEWANYNRRSKSLRPEVLAALTDAQELAGDRPLAEEALFRRGMVHADEGDTQGTRAFRADMEELLRRFPSGQRSDDALYQLATERLFPVVEGFEPDIDSALSFFQRLREFEGRNDYRDSAYYVAALGLVGRGREGDLDAADRLLAEYVEGHLDGVFRRRCLFWRGRIAERKGDGELAKKHFDQVVDEMPYDYYALRARMHREEGASAIRRSLPGPDSQVRLELAEAYGKGSADTQLTGNSPYHERVKLAASSGLYRRVLEIDAQLDRRLDDIPLVEIDERGLTAPAGLLLSYRLDAEAAKLSQMTAENWLRLAALLGHEIQDWPIAIEVASGESGGAQAREVALQQDPDYLPTVYPNPRELGFLAQPLGAAAWRIDGSAGLSQSLMYAVIRHESRFYPGAISRAGALGLFQFMPYVYSDLDEQGLVRKSGGPAGLPAAEFLLDPGRNIRLWATWVHDEFKLDTRDEVALSLMKHQAGSGHVRRWKKYWAKLAPEEDLEYRIETAGFPATANFVRRVLRDASIVEAAGFFESGSED